MEAKIEESRHSASRGRDKASQQMMIELGEAYSNFANSYPDAPETPEYLFRGGELYSNDLQDYNKAIDLFTRNYSKYPDHETAGNALFFVAYIYNNSLHDLVKAENHYKKFLEKYPSHKMAQSAKFELESLGMPVDQVFDKLVHSDSATGAQAKGAVVQH